jgi:hypothetical protein
VRVTRLSYSRGKWGFVRPETAGATGPDHVGRVKAPERHLIAQQVCINSGLKGLAGIIFSVVVVGGAACALTRALHNIDCDQVFAIIWQTEAGVIGLSLILVTASYGTITLYDWLALRTMGRRDIPYRIAALASFTSYPIAHGIWAVALISPIIYCRIYSRMGGATSMTTAPILVHTAYAALNGSDRPTHSRSNPKLSGSPPTLPCWSSSGFSTFAVDWDTPHIRHVFERQLPLFRHTQVKAMAPQFC